MSESLAQLKNNLKLSYEYNNSKLTVTVSCKPHNLRYRYACYLIANNRTIQIKPYQSHGVFHFDIQRLGNYEIKGYLLDVNTKSRVTVQNKVGFLYAPSRYYSVNKGAFINQTRKKLGQLFLEDNTLLFAGFKPFKFSTLHFWDLDPFKNRSWRWNLLQLSILPNIVSVYDHSLNKRHLQCGMNILQSWVDYSRSAENDKELWHDHGTALRLYNICFFFEYCLGAKFFTIDSKESLFMLSVLNDHIDKLKRDDFYSKFTNHGFDQSLFLYQVGSELEYLLPTSDVIKLAATRIIREVDHAFCADGGHKENSPAYLHFGIKQCLTALGIEQSYSGEITVFRHLKEIVDKATKALIHTIKPDGYLPRIGDTAIVKVNDIYKQYVPNYHSNLLYAISKGKKGTKPDCNFFVLPESGYAFIRSHWEQENFEDAIFFSLKASYLSNYHRHDDDLSVTLYGYKEDWLVDGGIYKYDTRDLHRKYIRSHHSHNLTSPVDAIVHRDLSARPRILFSNVEEQEHSNIYALKASTDMFENYLYVRSVEYHKGKKQLFICDELSHIENSPSTFVSRLFFNHDKSIELDKDIIWVRGRNKTLRVKIASRMPFELKLIKVSKEKIQGWLSQKNYELFQANLVEIHFKEPQRSIEFNMTLAFE